MALVIFSIPSSVVLKEVIYSALPCHSLDIVFQALVFLCSLVFVKIVISISVYRVIPVMGRQWKAEDVLVANNNQDNFSKVFNGVNVV